MKWLTILPILLISLVAMEAHGQATGDLESLQKQIEGPRKPDSMSVWEGISPPPSQSSLFPQYIRVIERDEILRSHETNLEDFLKEVGWLFALRRGPLGNGVTYHYQGHSSQHLLILLDGEVWSDPQDGSGNLTLIPLSMVERVEFYDGPAAALFPLGGGGGVINIVSRQFVDPQAKVETEVGEGNRGYRIVRANLQTPRSAFVVRTYYDEYKTRGYTYTVDKDPSASEAPFRSKNFSWEFQTRTGQRSKIISRIERYEEEFFGMFDLPSSGIDRKGTRIHIDYRHANRFAAKLYQSTHEQGTSVERSKNTRLAFMAHASLEVAENYIVRVTGDGGRTVGDDFNQNGSSQPRRKDLRLRALALDKPGRSLIRSFWLGAYFDNLSGGDLSGGLSLTWQKNPALSFWGSVSREVIPASLQKFGGPPIALGSGRIVEPNEKLEPEGLLGIRLGSRLQGDGGSYLGLSLFYTDVDNPIVAAGKSGIPADYVPSGEPLQFRNSSTNQIESRGIALDSELSFAMGRAAGVVLLAGYVSDSDDDNLPKLNGDLKVELDIPLFQQTTTGRLRWQVHGAAGENGFDDHIYHDAGFSFLLGDAQVYAYMFNVFDTQYVLIEPYRMPPRTWILGLTWTFTN